MLASIHRELTCSPRAYVFTEGLRVHFTEGLSIHRGAKLASIYRGAYVFAHMHGTTQRSSARARLMRVFRMPREKQRPAPAPSVLSSTCCWSQFGLGLR